MSSQYTPGPWSIPARQGDEFYICGSDRDGGKNDSPNLEEAFAAHVEANHVAFVEGEANAALIAAAPELLEALEEMQWAGPEPSCAKCESCEEEGHETWCETAALIAKAKGEQANG